MSPPPPQQGTDAREPKWRLSLSWLLLCGLVLLAGTAPSTRGELPGKPHLSLKLERFAVAGPNGDTLVSNKRVDDSGGELADGDAPLVFPPPRAQVDFVLASEKFPLSPAQCLPRLTRYVLRIPRAPPAR